MSVASTWHGVRDRGCDKLATGATTRNVLQHRRCSPGVIGDDRLVIKDEVAALEALSGVRRRDARARCRACSVSR